MAPSVKIQLEYLSALCLKKEVDVYVVGGTIRDRLLGREGSDFDFTGRGVKEIVSELAAHFKSTIVPLDDTPGRETLRVVIQKPFFFDFTEMQGNAIEDDLRQRDFTINAMAAPLESFIQGDSDLIDPNNGRNDLKDRVIRAVSNEALLADPLRILRAFRFAGALGFGIEPNTLGAISQHGKQLSRVAVERIYYELMLILGVKGAQALVRLMDQTGLLDAMVPEIIPLKNERPEDWEISLTTLDRLDEILARPQSVFTESSLTPLTGFTLREQALLKLAALFHRLDQGPSPNLGGNYNLGSRLPNAGEILERLRASNSDIDFTLRTIWLLKIAQTTGLDFAREPVDESRVYQFVKRGEPMLLPGLTLTAARRLVDHDIAETQNDPFLSSINNICDFYFSRYVPAQKRQPFIKGADLIVQFKLQPSALFKVILDRVEEARVLGAVKSRREAELLTQSIIDMKGSHGRKI